MNAKLKPYPEYRDSGVDWLGRVPAHWDVVRNGRLFAERNETGFPELPILEVSLRTGVRVRDMEGGRKQQMSDRAKYKRAAQNDIAYNIMRMWQGAVGVAPCDGLISPAYVVAQPLPGVVSRFYTYLFRTSAYMREVDFASRGIVPDRNRLYWQYFKPILSPAPPHDEQRRIAEFLDTYATLVQRLVAAKRRTITIIDEQRDQIIEGILVHHGTEVAVEMMLKRALNAIVGGSTPSPNPEFWNGEIVWITPPDISAADRLSSSRRSLTAAGLRSCAATVVPAGSVILTSRAPVGNIAIADVPLATNQGCKALVPNSEKISSEFLALTVRRLVPLMRVLSTGTTFQEISTSRLGAMQINLPSVEQQNSIIREVNTETRHLQTAKERTAAEIDLIVEYRDAMIAAVVTGQLDVRMAEVGAVQGSDLLADVPSDDDDMEDALEQVD
ncbi:restriction endonuclease subunit S [Methylocystis sp.]|uniref:restriction endonuclease subunit S n=1 Tax=Methylocystis sp. TaxID=1911079 RepID=UPI0025E0D731|nr:restriction endonuclease subunit S [Methylocystis sp.]